MDLASLYPSVYGFSTEAQSSNRIMRALTALRYHGFFKPQALAQVRLILRRTGCRSPRGMKVLDVGCGSGLLLEAFRRVGCDVQGADFQPEVVERARRSLAIPVVLAEAEQLTRHLAPASFDLITAMHVLEHVPNVEAVLAQCRQLLKPGGWFVGGVPLIDSPQAWMFGKRWVGISEAPRHLSVPSRQGLTLRCAATGFDRVTIRPDVLSNCAAVFTLSAVPRAATTYLSGTNPWRLAVTVLAASGAGLLALAWGVAENNLLRRPSIALVFAHKL
jgi:SAM-dependent methyltransferase